MLENNIENNKSLVDSLKKKVIKLKEIKQELVEEVAQKNKDLSEMKKEVKCLKNKLINLEKAITENENIITYCTYLENQIKNRDDI